MRRMVILLLMAALTQGCATQYASSIGQAADSASTVGFLSLGYTEGNPVIAGNLWLLAVKPIIPFFYHYLPIGEENCRYLDSGTAVAGVGAFGYNVLAVLTHAAVASVAAGIGSAVIAWDWAWRSSKLNCTMK